MHSSLKEFVFGLLVCSGLDDNLQFEQSGHWLQVHGGLSTAKRAQQPQGQMSRWGLVPGGDDTMELNLEKAGTWY